MATPDDSTDAQTQAPPAAVSPDILSQAMAVAQRFMPQPVQQDTTPVSRSWTSLLGQALAGGPPVAGMSDADKEVAGHHALMDFGTGLMAASRYQPGQTLFSNLAGGFQGAKQGEIGAEEMAMSRLGAQQEYAQQQAQNKLEALKTALPFLRMAQGAGVPNLLAGGGGPPAPNVAQGGSIAGNTYEGAIAGHEGTAPNPNSSASGVGQFLAPTWQAFAAANPDLFKGMSPEQVLAARSDPALGAKAIDWLAQQNAPVLAKNGAPVNGTSLGIAHYLGAGPAAAVMGAPDNAPVSSFVSPDAVKANPELGKMTVGQLKQRYANVPAPGFLTPPGGSKTAAAPAGTAAPPAAPAPYKVASTGAIPPPPSGAPTAPATTDLPVPPIPPTTAPPVAPAPQQTSQADQPPAPPPVTTPPAAAGPMTIEQYRALHPSNIDPSTFTVTPDPKALAQAEAERQTAAQNLQQARLAGDTAAANKALNAATEASSKIATLQQQAQVETAKMQLEAQNKAEALTQQGYNDEMTRQQQAQLKAQELAQTAAEADKQRQNTIEVERLKAGWTATQHQQDTDMKVGTDQLTGMQAQAQKAEALQPMLQQLVPLLKDPKAPEGMVGQFLANHTEWIPTLTAMGLDPKTANITQLVKGLTDYLSLDLKPTGTGALRNQELPMLQGLFANLGQSRQTQQQALSRILNYTQRVKNEYDMATENFGAVDPKTNQPNYKILYKNIDAPMQLDENGTRVGGGLGPVVPEAPAPVANPNPGQIEAARRYQKYVTNLPSGMPYNTYERQADGSLQRTLKIHD